jgi:hypothetical protein
MHNETVKTKINDHDYEISYLPAFYNYRLWLKFTSYIGSSFSDFLNISEGNGAPLGEGFNKLVSSLYVNDPRGEIIINILSQTKRDGVPITSENFDRFYTGNIGEMMEALVHSIKVHFTPFFTPLSLFGNQEKQEQAGNSAAS